MILMLKTFIANLSHKQLSIHMLTPDHLIIVMDCENTSFQEYLITPGTVNTKA